MRIRFLVLVVLLVSLVLVACDVDQPPTPDPTPTPSTSDNDFPLPGTGQRVILPFPDDGSSDGSSADGPVGTTGRQPFGESARLFLLANPTATPDPFNPAPLEEQLQAFADLKGILPAVSESMDNCRGGVVCDLIQDGLTVDPSTLDKPGWFLGVRKDNVDGSLSAHIYWAISGQAVLDDNVETVWELTDEEFGELRETKLFTIRYLYPGGHIGEDICKLAWDTKGEVGVDSTITYYFASGPKLEVPAELVPEDYDRLTCYWVCGDRKMWEDVSTTSEAGFVDETVRANSSFVSYETPCTY